MAEWIRMSKLAVDVAAVEVKDNVLLPLKKISKMTHNATRR